MYDDDEAETDSRESHHVPKKCAPATSVVASVGVATVGVVIKSPTIFAHSVIVITSASIKEIISLLSVDS